MTDTHLPPYPPQLSEARLAELQGHAIDWALAHGLIVRAPPALVSQDAANVPVVTHAPFALFPSPFPRRCYAQATELQPLYNTLVDTLAKDDVFIRQVMDSLSKVDDFTGKLYDIYQAVSGPNGSKQRVKLGLHRSDYLLHVPVDAPAFTEPVLQQVELNTIASSFSSLSGLASELHSYLLNRTNFFNDPSLLSPDITASALPTNTSGTSIAKGIAKAHELYGVKSAVAVMVVQPGERNAFDQRWIEYTLFKNHGVKLIRKSLDEIQVQAKLEGPERRLYIDGSEVAVTYFRAGYAPTDYPSDKEWQARQTIESSYSIKCPSIAYHLVGTKKVQQILALPGVVERFVKDEKHAQLLRNSFTGLYPLDGSQDGEKAVEIALERGGEGFVMKPQREGGGNNIYGADIPPLLSKMTVQERNAYILMDLIRPPPLKNIMVRQGALIEGEVVSELGVYGLWVSDGDEIHLNEAGGHLLRTKASTSNEGGVAAGFAVLDSPLLV
ncbi:hypothetical protein HK097_009708 [Rhizophlyctis rosea]|uniref:Glutathione synthetase n=1 Tax=Rhizophlyctis rosea TaxID=64517 RepID=A0AAD5X088_9FUNG|nr:hypothetical protein HK097_009708 [Rhizophlyctis rosea]